MLRNQHATKNYQSANLLFVYSVSGLRWFFLILGYHFNVLKITMLNDELKKTTTGSDKLS